jgi:hypothetical protein
MMADPSLPDLCHAYGQALGLDEPIPEPALRAIVADPTYARRLFACRNAPQMLALVLNYPPEAPPSPSIGTLAAHAAAALARWTRSGFATVDEAQVARRLAACRACPHLAGPGSALQILASTGTDEKRVCTLCGCGVERKARMATEKCPAPHPGNPALDRWGEPRA